MFSKYGHMKHWGLKTALAEDVISGNIGNLITGASSAALLYSLGQMSSSFNDPLVFSDLANFLKTHQLTNNFSREGIIRAIEGFLMSKSFKEAKSIKGWSGDQKSKLMILSIILSSTQSDDKQEIRILLDTILGSILDKTRQALTHASEEEKIKTKFIETIELIALNLRKNANQNPFIKRSGIVDNIERKLELALELMIENNSQNRKIRSEAAQVLYTLNKLQSQSLFLLRFMAVIAGRP